MNENTKKILVVFLVILVIFLLAFFIFRKDEDFTAYRETLQEATDQYIADTGCYPSTREVVFGNPSPIDFQKLYHKLPDDFELRDDLYYWITPDGRVWLSKSDVPEMEKENDSLIYDREGRLRYYIYYYEDNELVKEETREKKLDLSDNNYAVSEHFGNGLATPPANYNYEGYGEHRPIVKIKDSYESLALLSMIREKDRQRTPVGNMFAAISGLFTEEKEWPSKYGFDIYGNKIEGGEYEKINSILGEVRIKTEDGRNSHWIDLMDPTNVGACFEADWKIVEMEPIDPGDIDQPIYTPEAQYDTRTVIVKGGPKRSPDDFEDAISYTTNDGFSGLLYKYQDPFIEDGEEKTTYDYRVRDDRNFPETIEYDEDGFYGTLTLRSIIEGATEIKETRTARHPDRLPETIEYDEDGYTGTLQAVGDYESDRRSRGSSTRRKTVEEVITKNNRSDFKETISYSEGGYRGTLEQDGPYEVISGGDSEKEITETVTRVDRDFPDYISYDKDSYEGQLEKDGSYRVITEDKDTKTITEKITRTDRSFPDYLSYDQDGYEGRLEKSGTYKSIGSDSKTITETVERDDRNFPDYLSYDQDGYEGQLEKDGSYINVDGDSRIEKETIKRDDRSFPDYITYNQDGYEGQLDKDGSYRQEKVSSGTSTSTKTVTETVERDDRNFPDYITYNQDGYEGRLEAEGSYTTETNTDSKIATKTLTSSDRDFPDYITYNQDGYEGQLDKDGSYITDTKTVTKTVTRSDRNFPDYLSYDDGDHSGNLEKDGAYRKIDDDTFEQDYSSEVEGFIQDYSGEVTKDGSTTYKMDYSGEVTKDGSSSTYVYYQDYSGEVTKDGSSSTYVYYQDYSGEVTKDGTFKQDYKGIVESEGSFEQEYSGEVTKEATTKYEQDYTGTVNRTGDVYKMTYSGEVTRRSSGGSYTVYTQEYEGIIRTTDEDSYIGLYSGKVISNESDGYYQLYRGILRRARN